MLNKISIIALVWVSISAALPVEKPSFEEYHNMEDSIKVDSKPNQKLPSKEEIGFWIEPVLGGSNIGIGGGAGLVIRHKIDYIVSTAAHAELEWGFGAEPDELIEFNFLLGKNKRVGWGYLFARAGVGYVNGRIKKNFENKDACKSVIIFDALFREECIYDMDEISSLGVPLEAGVIWGKYLGIGVKLHANLSQHAVFGFKVVTALGKFNDW